MKKVNILILIVVFPNCEHFYRTLLFSIYGKKHYNKMFMDSISSYKSDIKISFLKYSYVYYNIEIIALILVLSFILFQLYKIGYTIFIERYRFLQICVIASLVINFIGWNSPLYSYFFD
ncbi:MAG: hypothetical protein K9I36_11835 [Bacteroidia bacterium]|nr:hypothetical protein [Bacteroidia bacterium]